MTSPSELPSRFSNWSYHDFNLGWVFGKQNPRPDRRKSTSSSIENGEGKGFDEDSRRADSLYWPRSRKVLHCILPACVAFNCTLAATIISPATSVIEEEFNAREILSSLPYTIYIIGIGAGALLGGPANGALGRKAILLATLSAFALSLLGAALSRTALELIILRGLAGTFAGAALLTSASTVSDLWRPQQRAVASLVLYGALLLAQAPGSIAGRLIMGNDRKSWRWTQAVPALAAVPLFLFALLTRETGPTLTTARRSRAWTTLRRIVSLLVRPSSALLGLWTGAALGVVLELHAAASAALPQTPGDEALASLAPLADDIGVGAIAAGTLLGLLVHLLHLVLVHGPLASRWESAGAGARRGVPWPPSMPAIADDDGGSSSSSARTSVVDLAERPPSRPAPQQPGKQWLRSPPPYYRLLAALPGTVTLPASLLVLAFTVPPSGAGTSFRFVPLAFEAVLAAGVALAFLAGLEYLTDAFEGSTSDDEDECVARVAVVAAYVGMVFAVAGGLAVGVHVGERAVGVKVVFGGLAAGLTMLGAGVWGIWFFGRRAARK